MLVKNIKRDPRSGQAMIEFLPAVLLFFVIIGTSLVFFIGLRESFQMQIAARNAMFAKIRNSGPLISTANTDLNHPKHYMFPFSGVQQGTVTPANTCFTAVPETNGAPLLLPRILGIPMALQRAHRATIFRRPAPANACD